ncbi:MAG TPA: hydroxymethylbilane synthase [Stellaceae bacterium]
MPTPSGILRIGTRGSAMALRQTTRVRGLLAAAAPELAGADAVEIVTIRTTGDRVQDRPLAEIGGKGLFAKEIDAALLAGEIDLAVHSLKDLETRLPDGIAIGCVLSRDDPRDALISRSGGRLDALPSGAVIGTASLRRRAQLLRRRPDLEIVPFRGNADTRLRKLDQGEVDATLLALCGLQRLGLAHRAAEILPCNIMLPAVGQGMLAVACRAGDARVQALLAPLDDARSAACAAAERALLAALDGSCRTPIAAFAEIPGETLTIEGLLLTPDGSDAVGGTRAGAPADAAALGHDLGSELRRRAGPEFGLSA